LFLDDFWTGIIYKHTNKLNGKRKKNASKARAKTVFSYNLKTKENKIFGYEEWNSNPLLGSIINYITKATFKGNKYYLFNPNSYKRIVKEFNCSDNWVKGLSSEGRPFTTFHKKFKHLEEIIR